MTQADLQKVLRAVDPAAVLVSPRILERVIRDDYQLPNLYWNIPHYKSYVCDRHVLFRHAEQADLELNSDELLPDVVILLLRPDAEEMSSLEQGRLLLKYWRRLFHAQVHFVLGGHHGTTAFGDQGLRDRVEAIGRTEFEEIREVLTQDRWLQPNAGDRETYVEFAAVYLELRYFAASLLPNYFPGIRDFGKIEKLLERDVDAPKLFQGSRPKGAADPIVKIDSRSEESEEAYWRLVRDAQAEASRGNLVGAAILHVRASRIAPAAQTISTRQEAERNIAQLALRLSQALALTEEETADWTRHLTLLLDKADQGTRPMEARVLEDLLRVCEDHEQEIYTLDLVEYFLSGGRRPIKRPLPSQRLVRVANHLRGAVGKLTTVRLSDADRQHLTRLIQQALTKTEDGLRTRFKPVLVTALEDVGLEPKGPLQQAAFDQMTAELLDRISTHGYLTFAELRDTISRNQLKLPDLTEPEDFLRGDPLIRLDRRLASLLDGVYRPGEFYVRWLERFTSLKFGTVLGRWLTRYVTGPLVAAWLVLFLIGFVFEKAHKYLLPEVHALKQVAGVLMGPVMGHEEAKPPADPPKEPEKPDKPAEEGVAAEPKEPPPPAKPPPEMPAVWWHVGLLAALSLGMLGLFHSPAVRHRCRVAFWSSWHGLRVALWDWPLRLIPLATLQQLVGSWLFQLLYWYLFKPAVVTLLLALYPPLRQHPYYLVAVFVLATFLLNSRLGRSTSEAARDGVVHLGTLVRAGLLPGLYRFVVQLFKQILEGVEYLLFLADESLRFRTGDSKFSLVVRTIGGVLWFPVAVVSRFYMVVLVEPMLNPVKLPITIIAAKVMYPLTSPLVKSLSDDLGEYIGYFLAYPIVVTTLFLLPDAVGWLVWEMKENWNLYRANRPRTLQPAVVGGHGETVRGLLSPGFHSGTVPHLYAKLRSAERRAVQSRNWHTPRTYRHQLEEVGSGVRLFVSREMVALLQLSRSWQGIAVAAGQVYPSTNRLRLELTHADHLARPVQIEIEHNRGWILAGIAEAGWLPTLTAEQLRVFTSCLAALYKRCDVDFVREQVRARVPGDIVTFQLTENLLEVWRAGDAEPLRFALRDELGLESLDAAVDQLVFGRTPLPWRQWSEAWDKDYRGEGHPGLPGLGELLVRLPAAADMVEEVGGPERILGDDRTTIRLTKPRPVAVTDPGHDWSMGAPDAPADREPPT